MLRGSTRDKTTRGGGGGGGKGGGGGLVGKSVWNSAEFRDYSNSGPFELQNFHRNFIFPTVKCVPINSERVSSNLESSPAINSSDFMNQKMFPPSCFFARQKKILRYISAGSPRDD